MACSQYTKRINPITGTSVVYDNSDGSIVTDAALIASLECCPEKKTDKEKVCLQPTGNTDPSLVVSGWAISVFEVDAAGVLTVLSTSLYSADLATDLTASHEVTDCPDDTPIDIGLCAPA